MPRNSHGKPNGLNVLLTENGPWITPTLQVTPIDRVADKIWDAVQEARDAGWDLHTFKKEVIEAWEHEVKSDAKEEIKNLRKWL